jgi:hypothetical protein
VPQLCRPGSPRLSSFRQHGVNPTSQQIHDAQSRPVALQSIAQTLRTPRHSLEKSALQRAEADCLADDEVRERQCVRSAEKSAQQDAEYINEFAQHILRQYPGCPAAEADVIASHACRKYSSRVE